MNDFATTSAPAGDIDAQIATLTVQETSTPQATQARLEKLEALHLAKSQGMASTAAEAPPEGLEGGSSPLAYTLEQHVPAGVDIVDQAGLGALKSSLHGLGVPPEIASGGFSEIAQLHAAGAFMSDAAYDQQIATMKATIAKVHGEDAGAIMRDAKAYLDKAVSAGKISADLVDYIVASPMAVSNAALLARSGRK